uniref:hypothetical protein n=2 Tax=Bacteria TaxID=2 RepID=UPI000AF42D63
DIIRGEKMNGYINAGSSLSSSISPYAEETGMKTVMIPCIVTALAILFAGGENLLWRTTDYYPSFLAGVRDVDNVTLLIPTAMKDICGNQRPVPELKKKRNGLYLRCGTPGIEGVWRIIVPDVRRTE